MGITVPCYKGGKWGLTEINVLTEGHTALESWDLDSNSVLTVTPGLFLLQHKPPTDMGMSRRPIMSSPPAMKSRLIMGLLFLVVIVICGLEAPARVI